MGHVFRENDILGLLRFELKLQEESGSKSGVVVRAFASHQCDPGSNHSINTICGLSLLSVLSFALKGFSLNALVFPSPQKNNISKF